MLKRNFLNVARLKVLIVAPSLDEGDVGEIRGTTTWIRALSTQAEVTVLSSSRAPRVPLPQQLPRARVVVWPELKVLYTRFERANAMAKLGWPLFCHQVKGWLREALARGEQFDIAHQMLPQAMRHASPLRHFPIPYVIGPLGGGLETPATFAHEVREGTSMVSRLRAIDGWRLRCDPMLRASYTGAELIIGVGPYIGDRLAPLGIKRFYPMHEIARSDLPSDQPRKAVAGQLALFHAGRGVRTKGLRDVVRALGHLKDRPGITLTSAGTGEDIDACKVEARRLGIEDRVTFLGRIPREAVEEQYRISDVFCFPSFREPLGGVLLEAMANGLPIITAARGGPDFVVDERSGIRVPVTDPETFACDIATAIRELADDPDRRLALGRGARAAIEMMDDWEQKASRLLGLYEQVLEARRDAGSRVRR